MTPLHFQEWPLGQQQPATAEKMGQQWVPCQHLTGLQWVPIANPLRYRSVAIGGFWEDGTSLVSAVGASRSTMYRFMHATPQVQENEREIPVPKKVHQSGEQSLYKTRADLSSIVGHRNRV